jgi:hypothetical protein
VDKCLKMHSGLQYRADPKNWFYGLESQFLGFLPKFKGKNQSASPMNLWMRSKRRAKAIALARLLRFGRRRKDCLPLPEWTLSADHMTVCTGRLCLGNLGIHLKRLALA